MVKKTHEIKEHGDQKQWKDVIILTEMWTPRYLLVLVM